VDEQDYPSFSWRRLEFAAVVAAAATVGCLFIGQTAEKFAENTGVAAAQVDDKPKFNAIDYATTGATKSGQVIIGPCDTRRP
jgi:hypothetical protein